MKIAIIGAGAVGSVIGGLLSKHNDVTLVGRTDHVRSINKRGLDIEGTVSGNFKLKAVTGTEDLPIQDVVVVTVKAYDLDRAIDVSKKLVGPGTMFLVVQNGLWVLGGPRRVSFAKVGIGIASMGATLLTPGKVRLTGMGLMEIGCLDGRLSLPTRLAQLMNEAGIRSEVTDDVIASAWKKTLINAAINPVTALTMEPNGSILKDPNYLALSMVLFHEGLSVARHWNVLDEKDVSYADVQDVIRLTAENRSSMLQDLERGKRTEIDAINGAICDLAPDLELVPANMKMVEIVKALETWRQGGGRK